MKKIFGIFMMAFAMFAMVSCDDPNQGFVYDVTVEGDADGIVNVTFPQGSLELNGQAGLAFKWSNDTTVVFGVGEVADTEEAAEVTEEAQAPFGVTAADGTYFIHVFGYAKEPITGMIVAIDRTFTNRANVEADEVSVAAE